MSRKDFLTWLLLGTILIVIYTLVGNLDLSIANIGQFILSSLNTLLIGIVFAFILNIPAGFFERLLKKSGIKALARGARALGILLAICLLILVIITVLGFIIPSLVEAVRTLSNSILLLSDRLQGNLVGSEPGVEAAFYTLLNWLDMSLDELYSRLVDFARENSPRFITSTFNTILGTINSFVTFFISFVFAIYFVTGKELIARHLRSLCSMLGKPKVSNYLEHLASISFRAFRHFVVAQVLEAIIIGCLCTAGMLLLALPNATMIGVLVGVTALIPVYGAFVGAIIGAIVIAVQSPLEALLFLIFLIILQQLEGNLIYPRVVGGSLGLPTVYTFTLVTVCGSTFGLVGMLFAVPVGSIVYTLLKERRSRIRERQAGIWSGQ